MQRVRREGTDAEIAVRSAVHRLGLRYRVDVRPVAALRRRADLVFPSARVAVFVDGCFWHGCAAHWRSPKANGDWWKRKIARNRRRDRDTDRRLVEEGWMPIRVWEHDDPAEAAGTIARLVRSRRRQA